MQHKICGSETQMGANNSSKWWLACKKVAKSLNSLFRVLSSTVYMWAQHYNPTQIWLFYREFWLLLFHSSPQPSFAIHNYLCLEPVILQAKKFVQKKKLSSQAMCLDCLLALNPVWAHNICLQWQGSHKYLSAWRCIQMDRVLHNFSFVLWPK